MALATLSIDIEARLAKLESGMDKAQRINARTADAIEKRWQKFDAVGKSVAGTLGTIFAGVSVVAITRSLVDGVDALNDFADATGSTVENASALEDVARRTGTTLDNVEGILVKFNAGLKDVDGKNGVSMALKAIGLDVEKLKQLDPAEALRVTAVELAGFTDEGKKARIVQELFGKSIREAGPFLKDLAEQGKLNATVTRQQAEEAEKFNKAIFALQKNVLDAARAISGPLVEALNKLFDDTRTGGITKALGLDGAGDRLEARAAAYELFFESIKAAYLKNVIARDPGNTLAVEQLAAIEAQARKTVAALKEAGNQSILDSSQLPTGDFARMDRKVLPSIKEPGKPSEAAKVSEAQRYLENLQKQADKLKELNSYEQALADIQAKRIDGITPKLEKQILAQAKLNDLAERDKDMRTASIELTTRVAKAQLDSIEKLEASNKALREEIELLGLDEYGQAAIEKARIRSIRTLKEEERARRVAAGAADETLQALDREIELLREREDLVEQRTQRSLAAKVDQSVNAVSDFSRRAAENIQDEIGNALYDTVTGNFDDILDRWADLLLRMGTQAQAAQIGKALFGESVGGSGSGLFGQLLGSIGGALFGSSVPTGDGTGSTGDFSRFDRGLYQAAEGIDRVPHDGFIAQLHKDEKVTPARYRDSGAGVINNISVKNESNDVQASARARPNGTGGADIEIMVKRLAKQAVAEDIGAGGQVDRAMRSAYGVGRQTPRRS